MKQPSSRPTPAKLHFSLFDFLNFKRHRTHECVLPGAASFSLSSHLRPNLFWSHFFFLLHLSPHCSHLLLFAPFGCWKIDNENKSAVTKERSSRVHFDVRAVCSEAKVWTFLLSACLEQGATGTGMEMGAVGRVGILFVLVTWAVSLTWITEK